VRFLINYVIKPACVLKADEISEKTSSAQVPFFFKQAPSVRDFAEGVGDAPGMDQARQSENKFGQMAA